MVDHPTELEVLLEQLDELLEEGAVNAEDALEIATVAGLAQRLGATPDRLVPAESWRAGPGGPLLEEAFDEIDVDELIDTVDDVSSGGVDDDEVDDALSDFDDLVAAATWAGRTDLVRGAARRVAAIVRQLPEVFAPLAPDGVAMARTSVVAEDPVLYDYWFAVADAAQWADDLA